MGELWGERWIVIPNWDGSKGFQHYTERDPIWIKNYVRLLHSDEYLKLTFVQRGVLHGLWLVYAASDRQVRDDTSALCRRLGERVSRQTLNALNRAGFIEFSASKPLAQRQRQRQTSPTEIEREAEQSSADALPISQSQTGENGVPLAGLAEKLLAEIRDADSRTRFVLHEFEQRLPDVSFAMALESLQHRRTRTDQKPLASEARYVVATLTTMEREGRHQ
jgi:hypothetical protein